MIKVCMKIIVILIPVILLIGFCRKMVNVDQAFMPTYQEMVLMFSSMPDMLGDVRDAVSSSSLLIDGNSSAWGAITDAGSFFEAIGSFFQMVGSFFIVAFQVVSIPFKFFSWFIPNFFGFAPATA